jgi:dipeptidyl aminopeptidase/acylaminoacyl peptidase
MLTAPIKRPIEVGDLFRLNFLLEASLSSDGERAVYVLSRIDAEKNKEYTSLYLLSIDDGETCRLTFGDWSDYNPAWSPDGRKIAFLSTRDGLPQIYLLPVDGGEARRVSNLKQGVGGGLTWSPDGSQLAFTTSRTEEFPDPAKPFRVTRPVYRFNAMGFLAPVVQEIFVISVEDGEARALTSDGWMKSQPAWSPDGEEILFLANLPPDSHNIYDFKIQCIDLQWTVRTLAYDFMLAMCATWTPDGKKVVFSGTPNDRPTFSKTDLWVVDRQGGIPQDRSAGLDYSVTWGLQGDLPERLGSRILISPDSQKAYLDVQIGGNVHVYEIALQGKPAWKPIITGDRCSHLLGMGDGKLLYAASDFYKPSDLYRSDLQGRNIRQLTDLHKPLMEGFLKPEVENLHFTSADGTPMQGWLMKPVGSAVPPYPTILYIHGGPQTAFGSHFSFDFNMLAGAGYAVLFINPRGSTGYGDQFTTAINGDWGNLDYQDIMAGVDHVIERGIADPNHLGITGASYGGYMTSWIVGHTERFKAAVIESPVTDLVSLYGTSDLGVFLCTRSFGGKPHEIPDVYRRCSPITYAHNCTTPTLLIQGENDLRSPTGQSEQFYTTLKASGCVVQMLRLPNSHHGGTFRGPPIVRQAQNEALLDWMNRYLGGVQTQE